MGSAIDQQVHLPSISRETVRAFVSAESEALSAIATAGGNIHHHQLDRQDRIAAFAATLSPEDAISFWTLYAEEVDATSAAMLDKAAELNIKTGEILMRNAQQASQVGTWIALVMFFAGLIIMISFLRR